LVGVEQWAELRREHFVRGVSIKALARRTGLSRNTVRAALRCSTPPSYQRAPGSKLDPFKDEIHPAVEAGSREHRPFWAIGSMTNDGDRHQRPGRRRFITSPRARLRSAHRGSPNPRGGNL
jgi:lambda repressor-like predicted transcriptional regulator